VPCSALEIERRVDRVLVAVQLVVVDRRSMSLGILVSGK
jgi:hypothetical protein